jgi:hypothetical protein
MAEELNIDQYKSLVKKPKKRSNDEYKIYKALVVYIKAQYPHVIWRYDMSGANLSMAARTMNKAIQKSRAYPDFFLAVPKFKNVIPYGGMYLEIKTSRDEVFNKDGSLKKKLVTKKKNGVIIEQYDHNLDQYNMLEELRRKGYYASYGFSLDGCIKQIDYYMKLA